MGGRNSQHDLVPAVYLAARSARRDELRAAAGDLVADGLKVVSSWIDDERAGISRSRSEAATVAARNIDDIRRCDVFVAFSEAADSSGFGRGGRHVEFGFALALGKQLFLFGPPEHVFNRLPVVRRFEDWASLREALRRDRGE